MLNPPSTRLRLARIAAALLAGMTLVEPALGGFGGTANPEDSDGGKFSWLGLLAAAAYLGGLYLYFSRAKNEVAAMLRLAQAVLIFVITSTLWSCMGGT